MSRSRPLAAAHVLGMALTACLAAPPALATDYPTKPVTLVVPFPAGGITDSMARLIAKELTTSWKQTVLVDNRPGASGIIGTNSVARAPKDGYTVLFTLTSHVQLPALRTNLPYDALKDFDPVTMIAVSTALLTVSPSLQVDSVKELVTKLKAEPDKYAYGSYGIGTTSNIFGELFKKQAGVQMAQVPYKGVAPLLNDFLGGTLNIAFLDKATAVPYIKSGKIKALAIGGAKRNSTLPEVPTFAELGYQGFEPSVWAGILMPSGTPPEIIQKMATGVRQALKDPAVQKQFAEWNSEIVGNTPAEFASILQKESQTWKRVIELGNVKLE